MSVLPINSRIRGPAPLQVDPSQPDIIDETLDLFRANSLFRNFEIKGPADRLLIVLILFISDCLAKISAARTPPSQIECTKLLNTLAVESFAIPGDAGFPLNAHYQSPASRLDGDYLRTYLTQVRQELACPHTRSSCLRRAQPSYDQSAIIPNLPTSKWVDVLVDKTSSPILWGRW
ncbi:unnamed protein product [Rhizoctonia solani]|uniref:Actin-related protein 2/3 complex subunit 3 n=1 Tax=Rhizoctonia solani TaxID=456999 RepID=A0A8H3GJE1_9AGAM|nr:unnamed protein product [Rhizoctonia solani]